MTGAELLEILEMLAPALAMLLVASWSVLCVCLGFRMGRQVVIPGVEQTVALPASAHRNVDIDKNYEDPWEEAMALEEPGARITGDMK